MKLTCKRKENQAFEKELRRYYSENVCDIVIAWLENSLGYVLKETSIKNFFKLGLYDTDVSGIKYLDKHLSLKDAISSVMKEIKETINNCKNEVNPADPETIERITKEYEILNNILNANYIYSVFEVQEVLDDTISTRCELFNSEEKALSVFNEYMEEYIEDLSESYYGYDDEDYTPDTDCNSDTVIKLLYTNKCNGEDLALYLIKHPMGDINNDHIFALYAGFNEVDEYLQGYVDIYTSKEDVKEAFNKEVKELISTNDLKEDDYYLNNYYNTFSMRYDLDIENDEKSDFCVDIKEQNF